MRLKDLSPWALLAGCQQTPRIEVHLDNGEITQAAVQGVSGATNPATLAVQDGYVTISTGSGEGMDHALQALSGTTSWAAIALIAAGLASLIGSAWLPFLPRSTSVVLIAAGGCLLAFPVLLDRYSVWIFVAAGGLLGLYLFGIWDNKRKLAKEPSNEQAQG